MPPLNVLVIDESELDAAELTRELSNAGYSVTALRVATPDALVAELGRRQWDLAISDYALSALSPAAAFATVRAHSGDVPFIFVSSAHGEDAAVDAMRIGAQDYITKNNLARLAPAVEQGLREAAERRERVRESERVAYLAFHDELTDLPNRTLLHDRLHQGLLEARRDKRALSLLVLDLDGFKEINDTLGHHAGDHALQVVATRLRAALRQSDTVARLGGDEFAILLPNTDAEGAELAAAKILQELQTPMILDERTVFVRGSIGIAAFPEHGGAELELLQKADIAMYIAKNDRTGFAVYSADRDGRAEQRIALLTAVLQDLDDRQFALDYQPIVDLRTGDTLSVEALLRWDHPQHGRLSPQRFAQLVEHSGLATQLTLHTIGKALSEWPSASAHLKVAVNVSPRSLHDTSFPGRVRTVLESLGADPSSLALEITENVVMAEAGRAVRCLNELHAMGIRLVVDDFGTGYSSLSHLRRLPVSQLKLDRSFVAGLAQGEDDALVRSIIDLAHNLKLMIVAGGVDTADLRHRLVALGCDAAQGRFIGGPAPAADIARLIARRDHSRFESV
jgi:diguanylate cyclase (GGDEF)-like protein